MQVIQSIQTEYLSGPAKRLLETVNDEPGAASNMMKTMARSPHTLEGYLQLSRALAGGKLRRRLGVPLAHLWGETGSIPYAQVARQFKLTLANVKTTAYRLRQRYRELLREEIAQTVSQPGEIDEEIRHLMQVVS
jgi:hypothetical protein